MLKLYEEVLLLGLHDEKGTKTNSFLLYGMAGGLLAELMLAERIAVGEGKRARVEVRDATPTGDPEIDGLLERLAGDKPRAIGDWVSKIGGDGKLFERCVTRLCDRGILRREESKVLWVFNRRRYPEQDPGPEQATLERLREAIRGDGDVDERTAALVSICQGMGLLKEVLPKAELKSRKARIATIADGRATGPAVASVIEAINAAIVVAVILPAITATTVIHN